MYALHVLPLTRVLACLLATGMRFCEHTHTSRLWSVPKAAAELRLPIARA